MCIMITDCGPRTKSFCGGQCRINRILDLAPAAFSAVGSLSSGRLPVWIYE